MKPTPNAAGLLGIFAHTDALVVAVREAITSGVHVKEVYSPVPLPEVEEILHRKKSPVRFVTFAGASSGFLAGMALALLTSLIWNLVVGGKPVISIVPFLVVGFELTILFGAIGTLLALLFFSRLPYQKFPAGSFRPEFTLDKFGLWLEVPPERASMAQNLLVKAGAVEVMKA
jgi:molybdopterin-containing oxidoreductase family membrane subunit